VVDLKPLNLRWIKGPVDDPWDLCAHGDVEFRISTDVLLEGAKGRNLTVSAAGLYLLRTLSVPHTKAVPVGEYLFPCCGFSMYDVPGQDDVVICGCANGVDFEVLHEARGAGVIVRSDDGRAWPVEWSRWREAVFGFADRVSAFYAAASAKQVTDEEDARGFGKFVAEWERRRGRPLGVGICHS
jgi:hypothetical protein